MIIGCGIDIEEIERFNKHYFHKGKLSDLMYELFTSREIENFSIFGKDAFVKGFSFKEAFYKAINSPGIDFKDIEIIFEDDDKFEIFKSSKIKKNISFEVEAGIQSNNEYVISKVLLMT